MKNLTKLMFGAILSLSSSMTFAKEGGVGNGGGVHWCPGKAPEMYDVYEGKRRYKLNIIEDGSRYEEILEKALERLKGYNINLAKEVSDTIKFLDQGGFSFEEKMKLHLIPDANVLMTDENCEYRQLANWDDVTQRVFVKNEYYEKMTDLNRAALSLHEAIYAVSRKRLSVTNSDSSRRVVAELLAKEFQVSSNLKSLTKFGDVMVKDVVDGVTEGSVSEEKIDDRSKILVISQTVELNVHAGSMDIASNRSVGEIVVRVPKIQSFVKELEEIKTKLKKHETRMINLSKKERKELSERLSQIEKYLGETTFKVDSKKLVNGVLSLPLTTDTFYIGGFKSFAPIEDVEAIVEFKLIDGQTRKTLVYEKNIKLATNSYSKVGASVYILKLNFSQNK